MFIHAPGNPPQESQRRRLGIDDHAVPDSLAHHASHTASKASETMNQITTNPPRDPLVISPAELPACLDTAQQVVITLTQPPLLITLSPRLAETLVHLLQQLAAHLPPVLEQGAPHHPLDPASAGRANTMPGAASVSSAPSPSARLLRPGLWFDEPRCRLWFQESDTLRPEPLTAQERAILSKLLSAAGTWLPRSQLAVHLSNQGLVNEAAASPERSAISAISRVRAKLRDYHCQLIRTNRRVGYGIFPTERAL